MPVFVFPLIIASVVWAASPFQIYIYSQNKALCISRNASVIPASTLSSCGEFFKNANQNIYAKHDQSVFLAFKKSCQTNRKGRTICPFSLIRLNGNINVQPCHGKYLCSFGKRCLKSLDIVKNVFGFEIGSSTKNCLRVKFLVASTATKTPVASATTPTALSVAGEQKDTLFVHNNDRLKYGIPPLLWDSVLESDAEKYAKRLASVGCSLQHSTSNAASTDAKFNNYDPSVAGAGENIAFQANNGGSLNKMADLVYLFINGPNEVVPATSDTRTYNHHTQILWRKTSRVGCAVATGKYSLPGYICQALVCRYKTPGNYYGENWSNPNN